MYRSIITGSGAYIPDTIIRNNHFLSSVFHSDNGVGQGETSPETVEKFRKITGIQERRYATNGLPASRMAAHAAELAIADSGIDRDSIDQLIVAHNFGDMTENPSYPGMVPSLASKVKHLLGIANPACIPYDLIFGCPGWLQGVIQADAFFKAGIARTALVIGTETLSRVLDPHDRDSMIFSDGAGATMLAFRDVSNRNSGVLSASVRADCGEEAGYISMGRSQNPAKNGLPQYIKMKGRKTMCRQQLCRCASSGWATTPSPRFPPYSTRQTISRGRVRIRPRRSCSFCFRGSRDEYQRHVLSIRVRSFDYPALLPDSQIWASTRCSYLLLSRAIDSSSMRLPSTIHQDLPGCLSWKMVMA